MSTVVSVTQLKIPILADKADISFIQRIVFEVLQVQGPV